MLVLITSSAPTIGVSNPARILSSVRRANGRRVTLNAFAAGCDVARPFLDRLARQNRGSLRRRCDARTALRLAADLGDFYRETSTPLLENVRFRYEEGVDESSLTTVDFPAYFEGSELVVVGRLRPAAKRLSVKVSGSSTQVKSTRSRSTVFSRTESGARFTKYLTTILRLSYDNAKVTIDLRRTSNSPNRLTNGERLFLGMIHLHNCKIVRDSVRKLAYDIPKRTFSTF